MQKTRHVLVVHSSAELYGSDRSLLDLVRGRPGDLAMTVVLPEEGPLVQALADCGARVVVGEVCKIQRGMLSPGGLWRTGLAAWRAWRFLRGLHHEARFDLVYSNSVAILGGALAARACGLPHVWHVREILAGSRGLTLCFRWLVRRLSRRVVCNSEQTRAWIAGPGPADGRYATVWNGFDPAATGSDGTDVRRELGMGPGELLVVMVGRVNAWKGQGLLVDAFAKAVRRSRAPMRLVLVGSAFAGQEHFERELRQVVRDSGCADRIQLLPFRSDIEPVWAAADIAVVPSTEPEPFGRVAIEAMAHGKPVLAAAHGGLVEIVEPEVTGCLVAPRDAEALAQALCRLADDAELRRRWGAAGLARQRRLFSVHSYVESMASVLRSALS